MRPRCDGWTRPLPRRSRRPASCSCSSARIDGEFRITSHGRAMASFGVHPRLAHMMLRGHELGFGATACVVAALLDERDPMRHGATAPDADFRRRVAIIEGRRAVGERRSGHGATRTRTRIAPGVRRFASHRARVVDDGECGRALALAFPDRVAQRRSGTEERYVLRNGLGAVLAEGSSLTGSAFLAVAELGGQRPDARVQLAAAIDAEGSSRSCSATTSSMKRSWNGAPRNARSLRCIVSDSAPSCFASRRCAMPSRWPWPRRYCRR